MSEQTSAPVDEAVSEEAELGSPMKKMFCVYKEDEERIKDIQEQFRLNRSDIMRRGLALLHDFLVKEQLPDGSPRQDTK